jgi:hypothetical protein
MSPKYTSLEDGQVIVSDEPRADLDALSRWERDDSPVSTEPQGLVPQSPGPVAGEVNTDTVTDGTPPLTSATAGIANPADTLSAEEAQRKAAEDAAANANGEPTGDTGAGGGGSSDGSAEGNAVGSNDGDDQPERPGLNGSNEEWLAYAKHDSIGLDVADDAGRDDIVAAYIEKFAPAGNARGEDWADYAEKHGVKVEDGAGREKIRTAVINAGWAKA